MLFVQCDPFASTISMTRQLLPPTPRSGLVATGTGRVADVPSVGRPPHCGYLRVSENSVVPSLSRAIARHDTARPESDQSSPELIVAVSPERSAGTRRVPLRSKENSPKTART